MLKMFPLLNFLHCTNCSLPHDISVVDFDQVDVVNSIASFCGGVSLSLMSFVKTKGFLGCLREAIGFFFLVFLTPLWFLWRAIPL